MDVVVFVVQKMVEMRGEGVAVGRRCGGVDGAEMDDGLEARMR